MGKYQRNKGANGEREVVNLLKGYGFEAKRISMMETNGEDKGDVEMKVPSEQGTRKIQVKIGEQVPVFIYKALDTTKFDFLFMRKDRKEWMVCMDIDTFIYLLMRKEIKE